MTPAELAVVACAAGSVAAFGLATLGLVRLPDLYARAHATSKGDTLGTLLAVAGVGLAVGGSGDAVKLLVLVAFVFVTTPTATHAVVRAASVAGYPAWTGSDGRSRGDGTGATDRRRRTEGGGPAAGDDRTGHERGDSGGEGP